MAAAAVPASIASAAPTPLVKSGGVTIASTGLRPGAIKHVWLIILENKSYDETFTGLNQNSYLWQTLPAQGVLLTNYYGTGHFSMDNYISLVSGQAPSYAVQDDCSTTANMTNLNSGIITNGTVGTLTDTDGTADGSGHFTNAPNPTAAGNGNYGQLLVHGGVDAPLASNGCVYPTDVPTLFNQFNAAGISWKAYAQDLGGEQPIGSTSYVTGSTPGVTDTVPGRDDGACGYPGTSAANPVTNPTVLSPAPTSGDITSYTGAQPANANGNGDPADQFVAKHFPTGWFTALTGETGGAQNSLTYPTQPALNEPTTAEYDGPGAPTTGSTDTNCDANHVANLDDPTYGLEHDLGLPANDVPAFNWITPDNCSDAHDATCAGQQPVGSLQRERHAELHPVGPPVLRPRSDRAGELHRRTVRGGPVPSLLHTADRALGGLPDGGLIDITFDEANPPFTIGNSFNNANNYPPTADNKPNYTSSITSDTAGENLYGRNVNYEPTGPNSTLGTNSKGDQLYPGPGNNAFVDRPPVCTQTSPTLVPADCVPGIVRGGAGSPPPARTDTCVTGGTGSSEITDPSILSNDTGREVTGTNIPANSFVGAVTNTGPLFPTTNTWSSHHRIVRAGRAERQPRRADRAAQQHHAERRGRPLGPGAGRDSDPLFNATLPTTGGGDTGSVLISPFIKPGTSTDTYYNHYSWLRTMEDIFNVAQVGKFLRHSARRPERRPAASTARATSATPPSRACATSARMCSTTRRVTGRPGAAPTSPP